MFDQIMVTLARVVSTILNIKNGINYGSNFIGRLKKWCRVKRQDKEREETKRTVVKF